MKRIQMRRIITGIMLLLWCVLIFTMSARPAVQSAGDSDAIVKIIVDVIETVTDIEPEDINEDFLNSVSHVVRKTAHLSEYLILGVLLTLFVTGFPRYSGTDKKLLLAAVLVAACMLYAVSDEVHQHFVPGRAMRATDVMIDTFGAALGVGFTLCSQHLYKKKKKICENKASNV